MTPLYAPSFSPGFSCSSGTGGQCAGLTQFLSFNIFLLAGYNQSQPACISRNCSDYPHLPKEQKQDTRVLRILYSSPIKFLSIELLPS